MRAGAAAVVMVLLAATVLVVACSNLGGLTGAENDAGADGGGGDGGGSSSGGSSSGGADAAEPPVSEGCVKVADAFCARLTACAPNFVQVIYGGPAACATQNEITCQALAAAPGSHVTYATTTACAAAVEAQACDDVLARRFPAACRPAGDYAEGATCIVNTQCASRLCADVDSTGCGKCRVLGGEGAPCQLNAAIGVGCEDGLVCGSGTKCITPKQLGQDCQNNVDCARSLQCAADNKCTPWALENQTCGMNGNPCANHLSLACAPADDTCVKQPLVSPGMACNTTTIGPVCLGGLCRPVNMTPTCTAWAKEGEACTDRPCLDPYKCNAGQCVLAKMSFCPN